MIRKLVYLIISLSAIISLAQAKQYSVAEIYDKMCSKCHGLKAEGIPEKKAPALNNMTQNELAYELFDLVANGSQSSGSNSEVMAHNQKQIMKKGMTYHPDDMALYISSTYGIKSSKPDVSSVNHNGIKTYSVSEIYKRMCSKCHGMNAEGNPEKHAPAINDMSKSELEMELYSLQSDGFQSSGSSNEIMTHNQKKIEDKGMLYHPEDMATYIYFHFNKKAKK
ncbi:c-type cytochrome [Sulfurospirillum arcachonense]|uniref:c-type cytochrome n=1 Tax=Sulfurospirillum arcachonense TaxID=57666 RepID=UPI00046808DB|nr:c-type cytochrome [Sulfurospirillum arcachonense]